MRLISSDPLTKQSANSPRKIGLIAGAGRFPFMFAEAARQQGFHVHCVGIEGMVDPALLDLCDSSD